MPPSIILATISAGFPDSFARAARNLALLRRGLGRDVFLSHVAGLGKCDVHGHVLADLLGPLKIDQNANLRPVQVLRN